MRLTEGQKEELLAERFLLELAASELMYYLQCWITSERCGAYWVEAVLSVLRQPIAAKNKDLLKELTRLAWNCKFAYPRLLNLYIFIAD